jgi:hypothetical protein
MILHTTSIMTLLVLFIDRKEYIIMFSFNFIVSGCRCCRIIKILTIRGYNNFVF